MDAIEGRVDRIEETVARLTAQVAGDGTTLSPGVVGVLERNSKLLDRQADRLDRVERTIDRARWSVSVGASVGSLFGGGLVFTLSQIFDGGFG